MGSMFKKWVFLCVLLACSILAAEAVGQAAPAERIWGAKPLLEHSLLSPGSLQALAGALNLDASKQQALHRIASQEATRLQALEDASDRILARPDLSLAEKQAWVRRSAPQPAGCQHPAGEPGAAAAPAGSRRLPPPGWLGRSPLAAGAPRPGAVSGCRSPGRSPAQRPAGPASGEVLPPQLRDLGDALRFRRALRHRPARQVPEVCQRRQPALQ